MRKKIEMQEMEIIVIFVKNNFIQEIQKDIISIYFIKEI